MISLVFIRDNFSLILYGVALILSIFQYRKYFDTVVKYFPILIGYTLLTEVLGMLINYNEEFAIDFTEGSTYLNSLVFNIFDICFFLYFFYIYWNVLNADSHKKWVKNGAIVFVIVSLVNPFFQDFILSPQLYSMIVGSSFLAVFVFLYIKQLFNTNDKGYPTGNLLYWISIGLLLFYPFYPIIFIIVIYFDNSVYHSLHVGTIHQLLICLMYTCFIIGFLKMRRFKFSNKEEQI